MKIFLRSLKNSQHFENFQSSNQKFSSFIMNNYQININKFIENCENFNNCIKKTFNLINCSKLDDISNDKLKSFNSNEIIFVNSEIDEGIDKVVNNCLNNREKLYGIANKLSEIIGNIEKGNKNYVKIHETPKSDPCLIATNRRCTLLKNWLKTNKESSVSIFFKNYNNQEDEFSFDLSDINFGKMGSNKKEEYITNSNISKLTSVTQKSVDLLILELQKFFNNFIKSHILNNLDFIDTLIDVITKIDLSQSKAYIAHKFNYCKPIIEERYDEDGDIISFFDFSNIRHPLIEHLQTNELYVTNNLSLSNPKEFGLLLYGTNAVGKTSFIKSIGISVIMAQAGLFVPCKRFKFYPFKHIFTRILGNDNIFKGLSTFAVEMVELRHIIKLCNKNSLILGDELCSGTESDSALSIFTAGIEHLYNKKAIFLFATHFHEICGYDEIKNLDKLKIMHMEVNYNREKDILIYDRKLKDGPGDAMYGLEVCKSLNLPNEFLERAYQIRNKYNNIERASLENKQCIYNSKKIKGLCEICKKTEGVEIHHLIYQKKANSENNYILSFHKNHKANLVNICEKCHNLIHNQELEFKKVKTSNGYQLEEIQGKGSFVI